MEKELFDQLKELLTEKFNHLEKTIQGIEDRNTEDHRTMKQQIGELFEENKKQNKEVDERFDRHGVRMGKHEAEQARMDERHKMAIWFVGLGVGVASGIVSFVISLIK